MDNLSEIFQTEDSIEIAMKKADAILSENPSDENLKDQYADMLLDTITLGQHRYYDLKEIKGSAPFKRFQKLSKEITQMSPIHKAIIAFFNGQHDCVLSNIKDWFAGSHYMEFISPLDCNNFIYFLVLPFKEAFPGFWS
jgi:hypothetical protein